MNVRQIRMQKELAMLERSPPPGVSAWLCEDNISNLNAVIQGPEGTPYENGIFKLELNIPDRYPNDPPKVRFITKVYHPNIDNAGRICLDTLKMPPKGAWTPSLNIPTLLTTIRLLLSTPNPDDPLMPDITEEFRNNHKKFYATAQSWTKEYAVETNPSTLAVTTTSTTTTTTTTTSNDVHETVTETETENQDGKRKAKVLNNEYAKSKPGSSYSIVVDDESGDEGDDSDSEDESEDNEIQKPQNKRKKK